MKTLFRILSIILLSLAAAPGHSQSLNADELQRLKRLEQQQSRELTPEESNRQQELQKAERRQEEALSKSKSPDSESNSNPEMKQTDNSQSLFETQKPRQSTLENIFIGKFPTLISRQLEQFGYDLFDQEVSSFTPIGDIPISSDYIVGPGDVFTVNVWGSQNFSNTVTVRRDGTIFIPKIGAIKVWGKTYNQTISLIRRRLNRLYKGIKINISFEAIRKIDVFVVGEVEKPGSYSIPSTSTAINALFHAGGPTKNGSLRNIQIMRGDKKIADVDLYDFLVSGKVNAQQLQSQDVILVPVIGKVTAVAGSVKRPAIYEITEETNLYDVIKMAGGLNFAGQVGRLSLERVAENKERVTKDYRIPDNFKNLSRKEALQTQLATKVHDGDLIQIFSVLPELEQTVFLKGHVNRPGAYEFTPGMVLSEIIPSFEVLKDEPYTEFVQIIRTQPPSNEKLSVFTDIGRMLSGDKSQDIELQEGDEIIVFSKEELDLMKKVHIEGKVNRPGSYNYFPGMTLRDLVFMAGNVKEEAYLTRAEIARYKVLEDGLKPERFRVNLREVIGSNPANNPVLEPRDRVFVQSLSNWETENYVTLEGEVKYPGSYPFLPGERLSTVIERAGGFTKKAFLKGAFFARESVRRMQKERLDQQITRLEEAILYESLPTSSEFSEKADAEVSKQGLVARKALLRQLQEAEVSGRMVIRVDELDEFKGSKFDIRLEAGDRLRIPPIPSTVMVMGEVYNETSMVYEPGKDVSYYLERAGGPTINADTDGIFVIKADGSVISRRQNRGFLLRGFYQAEVDRGDTILVPKDISKDKLLRKTRDITEILFKIASTTGITIAAFK